MKRANASDVDGLVTLYEPDAVLDFPCGALTMGSRSIRRVYGQMLADKPRFAAGEQRPALVNGDLVLCSTRLPDGGATVEVARRQPDGRWLRVLDRPNVLG